jgi:sarcosine oxidase
MSSSSDVAVIGAGVFGAWIALQVRRTGRSVTLVDAFGAGHTRSSSGGTSRVLRIGYGSETLYSRWAQRSMSAWLDLFRDLRQDLFTRTGVLWMTRAEDRSTDDTIENLRLLRVPFESLDRTALEQRYPQFNLGPITRGVLETESGVVMARHAVQAVVRQATKQSVAYRVTSVTPPTETKRADSVLTSDGDQITAGTFVFACGPWLPKLFPEVLGNLIRPTRQEVFFFGAEPGDRRFTPPAMPAWFDFAGGVYGVPDLEGRGFKVGLDHHGPAYDPDRGERLVTDDALKVARIILARRVPALEAAPLLEAHICQYSNSWNGDFLIDRHPDLENVWLVGGGSGHGFKHGPAVGDYVAAQLDGRQATEPRFTLALHKQPRERSIF